METTQIKLKSILTAHHYIHFPSAEVTAAINLKCVIRQAHTYIHTDINVKLFNLSFGWSPKIIDTVFQSEIQDHYGGYQRWSSLNHTLGHKGILRKRLGGERTFWMKATGSQVHESRERWCLCSPQTKEKALMGPFWWVDMCPWQDYAWPSFHFAFAFCFLNNLLPASQG